MAHTDQPGARRRAPRVRRERRRQVLQLRQLLRGLRALRGAARPPAPPDARVPAGARGQAQGEPRALAVLLLRRVLGAVSQGGRAGRDHDEHAPLAHGQVRLQRPQRAVLPLARLGDHRHRHRGDPHRHRLRGVRHLERRQLQRVRRRERLPARPLRPPLRLGDGDRAGAAARHQRAAHVAQRDGRLGRRHRLVPRRPAAAARTSSSRRPSTSSAIASVPGPSTWR